MFNLLLDILIYNYTSYKSFFFLLNINNKSIFYNLLIAGFIDLFIMPFPFFVSIYTIILWIIKRKIKFHNLFQYYLFNILIIIIFFVILNDFNWNHFWHTFIINSIYIFISYKKDFYHIKCMGDINWKNI